MIGNSRGGNAGTPAIGHDEAEALISARLDVVLDSRQEQILRTHLSSCSRCRQFATQMEAMHTGLRDLPRLPASPIVSRQVRERIAQPRSILDRLGGLFGGHLGAAPVAAIAAVLVMMIGAYALLGDDPENGRLGPTISAGTQIADQSTTSTALVVTETTSQATVEPGEVLPTETKIDFPVIRASDETPTPTEEPTNTPEPTETGVPAQPTATTEPTDEPTATEEPTDEPTETPEPTATEVPTEEPTETPEPTETEVPTLEPTETEEPTETPEPTATETPEPTATETEEPTEEPTATEQPTETEEPTEEPTQEPAEEPTSTQPPIVPIDETPIEDDGDESDTELALPDPTEDVDEETGDDESPPIESTGDEEVTEEVEADPTEEGGQGGEVEAPQGGDSEEGELPLDNTRKITDITSGGAPTGPLRMNTPESMMVLSADSGGGSLQVVGVEDGAVYMDLGASAYPIWSPLGMVLLYQDLNSGVPSVALYDSELGLRTISDPTEEGAQEDIPAGWAGTSAYFLRVMGDEASTVVLYAYEVNEQSTTEVWRSEGVTLAGSRPIPTGDGFLIATAASWLLVTASGDEIPMGIAEYGLGGEGFPSPFATLVAYPANGQLVIASIESPGIAIGLVPYSGGPGSGFSWAPDGSYVVVSDGASLQIYDTSGNFMGAAESASGVVIAAPQWLADGIYYVEIAPTPSLRRILVENIPGFGG